MRLVDRVAYINHDIDDAVRAGVLRAEELPAEGRSPCSATPARAASTRSSTTSSSTPSVAGDIVQGERGRRGDGRSCAPSCSSTSTSARSRAREHAKIERVVRTLFEHYVAEPDRIPDGGGAPDADLAQRVTDYLAGMTDRYCIRAFEALSVPEAFAL